MGAPLPPTALLLLCSMAAAGCSPEATQTSKTPSAGAVAAQPPLPPPPAPVSAEDLPPRLRVDADGIVLTEFVDGRVRVQTTTTWSEALVTTYDDCDYYRGAVPVLQRQLAPERAKHLAEMCALAPPVAKDPKAARRAKAAQSAKAKPSKAVATPAPAP